MFRKFTSLALAGIMILCLFLTACGENNSKPSFSKPSGFSWDGANKVITFTAAEGAEKYTAAVYVKNTQDIAIGPKEITEASLSVGGLSAGDYTLKIKVNATDDKKESALASFDFTVSAQQQELPALSNPQHLTYENSYITWYPVEHAANGYHIKVYKQGNNSPPYPVDEDISETYKDVSDLPAGSYKVEVYALAAPGYLPSNNAVHLFTVDLKGQTALIFSPASATVNFGDNDNKYEVTAATGGSGSGLITYNFVSGPAAFDAVARIITVTGAGTVKISATKAADAYYSSATAIFTLNVSKGTPSYTAPTGLTAAYGSVLSSVSLPGGWSWVTPGDLVGDVGARSHQAKFTPGDTANYETVSVTVSVNVVQSAGSFVSHDAINTTYTTTLKLSDLSLASGYAWATPATALNAGGSQSFAATYTDPSGNYAPAPGMITVNVAKAAAPPITFPSSAGAITYGQTLASSALNITSDGNGTFAWTNPATKPTVSQSGSGFEVTYTPADTANYDYNGVILTATVAVSVSAAEGGFGSPSAISVTYSLGLKLGDLNPGAGYQWVTSSTSLTVADSGKAFAATYTDPSGNYAPANGEIVVNVAKATGNFGSPAAINTTYTAGLKLSDLSLESGYAWGAPATALSEGSGQSFAATYTDPSGNYEAANGSIVVNVAKADGSFVNHKAIDITYTKTLTLADLEGELDEEYAWESPETSLNAGGGQSFAATYTDPSGNYAPVSGYITVNVAKAAGSFVSYEINAAYSTTLTLAGVGLTQGYEWLANTSEILNAGSGQEFAAKYTDPSGNYEPATGKLTVNVAKAKIAKPTVAPSGPTYTGVYTGNVQTGVVYNDTACGFAGGDGIVQTNAGNYTSKFSLNSTDNYEWTDGTTGTVSVSWQIAKAAGSFGSPAAINTTYTPTLTLADLTGNLANGYAWLTDPSTVLTAGNGQKIDATYTDPNGNYEPATGKITVNVAKAKVTVPTAITGLKYTGAAQTGINYDNINSGFAGGNAVTQTDVGDYTSEFSLNDKANYEWADGTVENVSVSWSIAQSDGSFGNPAEISVTYSPGLKLSNLSLALNYAWVNSSTALTAGNGQEFYAVYTDPSGNFAPVTGKITVNVAKAKVTKPTAVTGLKYTGAAQAGVNYDYTNYSWVNTSSAVEQINVNSYTSKFSLNDTDNYEWADETTGTVSVSWSIEKASGSFVGHAPIDTTYTTTLKLGDLNPGMNYTWVTASTPLSVSDSGTAFAATYTDPSGNYEEASGGIVVNVAKAAGSFVGHAAINATYTAGLTLAGLAGNLTAGYAWKTPSTVLSVAGSGTAFDATYTDLSGNYETANGTIIVNITKAAGSFVSHAAINATYTAGLTLAGLAGNLTACYAWKTPSTPLSVSDSGTAFAATYTDPSGNYETASGTIIVNVAKAIITFTQSKTYAYTYGELLSGKNSLLATETASVSGTFAFKYQGDIPTVGVTTAEVVFTPTDTTNYSETKFNLTISVAKATPSYTAPTGLTAMYGETLANVPLTSFAGWSWVNVSSTQVGNAGTQTHQAKFTPSDTVNYETVTIGLSIEVAKVTLTVTAENKSKTYDGAVFNGFSVTYSGFISGENSSVITGGVTYTGTAPAAVSFGTYTITPVVSGLSAANYNFTQATGQLSITKKEITVSQGAYNITKVYDGTTSAGTGNGNLDVIGIISADIGNVTVTATPGVYPDSAVGSNYTVEATLSLSGGASGNYQLASLKININNCSITGQSGTQLGQPVISKIINYSTDTYQITFTGDVNSISYKYTLFDTDNDNAVVGVYENVACYVYPAIININHLSYGNYKIVITAVGNGTTYLDSSNYEVFSIDKGGLLKPQNLTLVSGDIEFEDNAGNVYPAEGYFVEVWKAGNDTNAVADGTIAGGTGPFVYKFSEASQSGGVLNDGIYTVKIKALSEKHSSTASDWAVIKLEITGGVIGLCSLPALPGDPGEFENNGSLIKFDAVQNAAGYNLTVKNSGGTPVFTTVLSTNEFYFDGFGAAFCPATGVYTIEVYAKGDGVNYDDSPITITATVDYINFIHGYDVASFESINPRSITKGVDSMPNAWDPNGQYVFKSGYGTHTYNPLYNPGADGLIRKNLTGAPFELAFNGGTWDGGVTFNPASFAGIFTKIPDLDNIVFIPEPPFVIVPEILVITHDIYAYFDVKYAYAEAEIGLRICDGINMQMIMFGGAYKINAAGKKSLAFDFNLNASGENMGLFLNAVTDTFYSEPVSLVIYVNTTPFGSGGYTKHIDFNEVKLAGIKLNNI